MTKEFDIISDALQRAETRIDKMADALGEVGAHCATLLERTEHLATRHEITEAIRLHSEGCRSAKRMSAAPNGMNGTTKNLLRALAAFLTVAGAAIAAYCGFAD